MRRSVIAFLIVAAGLLAAACTQPSGGAAGSAGAPAVPAASAPASAEPVEPGY